MSVALAPGAFVLPILPAADVDHGVVIVYHSALVSYQTTLSNRHFARGSALVTKSDLARSYHPVSKPFVPGAVCLSEQGCNVTPH